MISRLKILTQDGFIFDSRQSVRRKFQKCRCILLSQVAIAGQTVNDLIRALVTCPHHEKMWSYGSWQSALALVMGSSWLKKWFIMDDSWGFHGRLTSKINLWIRLHNKNQIPSMLPYSHWMAIGLPYSLRYVFGLRVTGEFLGVTGSFGAKMKNWTKHDPM